MRTLRWVILAPAAIGAAYAVWLLVTAISNLTLFVSGIDPRSFFARAYVEAVSASCMGAAFVYAGARVAPIHRKRASFVLTAVGLLAVAVAILSAAMVGD